MRGVAVAQHTERILRILHFPQTEVRLDIATFANNWAHRVKIIEINSDKNYEDSTSKLLMTVHN
jgi:hypothetical protein